MDTNRETQSTMRTSRRTFLKAGVFTAAAGTATFITTGRVARAAGIDNEGILTKAHVTGASVKKLGYQEGWLGTSKIVAPVQRTREQDQGFNKAIRGLLGSDAEHQVINFIGKHPLGNAFENMSMFLGVPEAVNGKPSQDKLPLPNIERLTQHIKDVCYYAGADEVGVGKLFPWMMYSEQAPVPTGTDWAQYKIELETKPGTPVQSEKYQYCIGILVDQGLDTLLGTTGYDGISGTMSMMAYSRSGFVADILAKYIRNLGYNARSNHNGNYAMPLLPALISCGLGEMSRTGDCVLHPRLGFRHKAAVVVTDLPLVPDGPIDFGLRDFCSTCQKCAQNCPAQAIGTDRDQTAFKGQYMRWAADSDKCTQFRTTNREGSSCGRCMKVCPWNNKETSWIHDVGVFAASNFGFAGNILRDIDDMFGYGTEVVEKNRWWLEWPEYCQDWTKAPWLKG
ncbi:MULTISPECIES: reductive dehalogenase [unclassified Dehalobacter]|uniref:reductive dehalogenase n=1 Tax=unclassified Dehalobacter TaxID=2635733 RepID=UPI000E6BCC74|nr:MULTISPECIES: reductive dehalogenase [unclassified Dehalobacter]RJE46570.1 reductive dehalogenase [Dehalobacter sp. MCB1]TCX47879.1 reductive dehalogenase [Dehalobacter sp. 14DCB1]TCX55673.1 reductive dehalogenase [Dehalobacter sp. 12DCB1]